jgi:hypothetical protein
VMHIPSLARNLLSVSSLNDIKVQVLFFRNGCKMTRGSMVLARGARFGTRYKLDEQAVQCNSVSGKSLKSAHGGKEGNIPNCIKSMKLKLPIKKTVLCHHTLGHIGEKGLKTLKNKNLVEGLEDCNFEFEFCEQCIYGKQHRVSFYDSPHKSFGLLAYIHSDVFGLVNVPSLSESRYYVSFIDDYLRR